MSEWISAKEKSPPVNTRVVMHCKYRCEPYFLLNTDDYICVGYLDTKGVYNELSNYNRCTTNHTVDYWMPLPNMPESESDAE